MLNYASKHGEALRAGLLACTLLATGAFTSARAVVSGDRELLKLLATQNQANREAISTWQGTAIVEHHATRGDDYEYQRTDRVEYALDQERDALRWNMQTEDRSFNSNGQDYSGMDADSGYRAGLVRDGVFYQYDIPESLADQDIQSLIVRDQQYISSKMTAFGFDPRQYSTIRGTLPAERLLHLYQEAENPELSDWNITRDGSIVTLEARFGPKNQNINRYVYDLAKGGNIVKFLARDESSEQQIDYDYEAIDGVWAVRSYDRKSKWTSKEGMPCMVNRKVQMLESAVNKPIDEDAFTIASLGVSPGDWVLDTLADLRFRYQSSGTDKFRLPENLELASIESVDPIELDIQEPAKAAVLPTATTEAESHTATPASVEKPQSGQAAFWVAGVAALVLALGFLGLSRRKAGKTC